MTSYPTYGASETVAVGQTMYFGDTLVAQRIIDHPRDFTPTSINVSGIRPVVRANTADADIAVLRCVSRVGGPPLLGQSKSDADAKCTSLRPFNSGRLTVGFNMHNDDIVIAITPRRTGVVKVAGVTLEYSSGARHGTQHTGPQLKTVTK
jgi:hypothetical protein